MLLTSQTFLRKQAYQQRGDGDQTWANKALIRYNMLSESRSEPSPLLYPSLTSSPCIGVVEQSSVTPKLPSPAGSSISLTCPGPGVESSWNPLMGRKLIPLYEVQLKSMGCFPSALHLPFELLPSQQEPWEDTCIPFFPESCQYDSHPRYQVRPEYQTSYICRKKRHWVVISPVSIMCVLPFTFKQSTWSFLDNLSLSFFPFIVSHSKAPKVI